MRAWQILTVLLAGLLGSQPAFAAKASSLDKQAMKACLSGDYQKGVSILADLFVETGDATYLWNQGRCYEQNVHYVEAAERFREYLRKAPRLSAKVKAETEKHIAECEAAIARSRLADPPPPSPPRPEPTPLPPPQPAPAPQVVVVQSGPAPVAPASETQPWQHSAKWVALGGAVVFLGVGVVEHLRYYSKNKDYNDNGNCPADPVCKGLADSADTAQIVAIMGYSAAAVATGLAVTFFLTDKPSPAAQHAGLRLTCAPGLAGVSCAGSF
jgi:hypothetical protein